MIILTAVLCAGIVVLGFIISGLVKSKIANVGIKIASAFLGFLAVAYIPPSIGMEPEDMQTVSVYFGYIVLSAAFLGLFLRKKDRVKRS